MAALVNRLFSHQSRCIETSNRWPKQWTDNYENKENNENNEKENESENKLPGF
jgi:hypothetical protein